MSLSLILIFLGSADTLPLLSPVKSIPGRNYEAVNSILLGNTIAPAMFLNVPSVRLARSGSRYLENLVQALNPRSDEPSDLPISLTAIPEVGILCAGIEGLYAALFLQSVIISYKVIEESDRTGGCLFTQFKDGGVRLPRTSPHPSQVVNPHEYKDVGAMRFPDTLIMNFLWSELGVEKEYIEATVMRDGIQLYADETMKDLATPGRTLEWEKLMELNAYSLRTYMSAKYMPSPGLKIPMKPPPTAVVDWLPVCRGGQIQMKSRVTGISSNRDRGMVDVGVRQEGDTETAAESFEDVISTLPIPFLRTLDLQKSGGETGV
ncbi:hypothetical protein BD779DRAFT_1715892 [Infundibulicybe gibba]|nr:hypothetical protein BD779DRAFT_1715892 [Infundibulicybe gibba]